jgi:hypothetical protein
MTPRTAHPPAADRFRSGTRYGVAAESASDRPDSILVVR